MVRACHARVMLARVMRGVTWRMGGAMRRARRRGQWAARARGAGCPLVTRAWRANGAHTTRMRSSCARDDRAHGARCDVACGRRGAARRGAMRRARRGRLVACAWGTGCPLVTRATRAIMTRAWFAHVHDARASCVCHNRACDAWRDVVCGRHGAMRRARGRLVARAWWQDVR